MKQFFESGLTETPLGKFFTELVTEDSWLAEYTIDASFNGIISRLAIHHETFLPGCVVTIKGGDDLTTQGVEKAIRKHLGDSRKSLYAQVQVLQRQADAINHTIDRIDLDKAWSVITSVFPAAQNFLKVTGPDYYGLYSFFTSVHTGPVFVARKIADEFVGGVARMGVSPKEWSDMPDGINRHQKWGYFWLELARQCAEAQLGIPRKDLLHKEICTIGRFPDGRYHCERVLLETAAEKDLIAVEFRNDVPVDAAIVDISGKEA
ncbi:MAG: hypothetical protein WCW36_02070 [Candidatus Paceibacterota bacterium]